MREAATARDTTGSPSAASVDVVGWIFAVAVFIALYSLAEVVRSLFSPASGPSPSLLPYVESPRAFSRVQRGYGTNALSVDDEPTYEQLLAIADAVGDVKQDLTEEQIALVTTKSKYAGPAAGGEGQTICAVCLRKFAAGDDLLTLPCGCMYDERCIMRWLAEFRANCPQCRCRFS
jgi:hypothetical protein